MDQRAYLEMTRMLENFPLTNGNPDLIMSGYELAINGLSAQAIIEAAQRFIGGLVEGQSLDFSPTAPRFAQEARRRQEYIDIKAKPGLQAPNFYHHTGSPFHIRQQKTRTKYQECEILAENVGLDEYRRRVKEFPEGHAWIAALATVFGPPAMEIALKA